MRLVGFRRAAHDDVDVAEGGEAGVAQPLQRLMLADVGRCRSVLRPRCSIAADTSSTASGRRPVATTFAPASARPSASARPMPVVPPTTTAVRPLRSNSDGVIVRPSAWEMAAP
jgi:hypothetical protein